MDHVWKNDWQDFQQILSQHGITKLYHFTDRSNLQSIVDCGGLLSLKACADKGVTPNKYASSEASRHMDMYDGFGDYVRLGFAIDHPMKDRAKKEGRITDPVVLEIKPEVIFWIDTKFSDINAVAYGANIGDSLADFNKIKFDVFNRDWSGKLKPPFYQAEVMVKSCLPIEYITNIHRFGIKPSPPATITIATTPAPEPPKPVATSTQLTDSNVNTAEKSNAAPLADFSEESYANSVAATTVGDTVVVYIENHKNDQLLLSHKKGRTARSWDRVNEAMDNNEIIDGYVKCRTKGGMIVDVLGIEAFLPGSQIDVKPIKDYDFFVGKTMEFKVIKINQKNKNVVVSHRALLETEVEAQRQDIMAKLERGQVLEGTVKNIVSYGAFIDLGGVDGLVHITDMSWGRVSNPSKFVKLGQKLNVVILDIDKKKKRIALGLKQLTPHPWLCLSPDLKVGDRVVGKIVAMADYGAFIEIVPGVEGIIHVSEMSWSQHLHKAQDNIKVGQEVESVILTLDRKKRKMSLGVKQLKNDPWKDIEQKYPIGSKHVAKVRNFTNFGIFVEIEEGIDGLIHISDLSWTKKVKHPSEFTKIGEMIDVIVLDIDKEKHRISLDHKQLED